MKKFNVGLAMSVVALLPLLSLCPLNVHAETIGSFVTMELTGTGSLNIGNDAAYPYYISVDSGGNISMMCVSYDNDIYPGESWVAQVGTINTPQLQEAAWLFNDDNVSIAAGNTATAANNPTLAAADYAQANDDQWAAWEIFSTNAQNTTPPGSGGVTQAGAAAQLAAAEYAVAMNTEPESFYQQFVINIPQWGWPAGADVPQNFIGYADSPPGPIPPNSPEPGSLILFGTGMLGMAVFIYRRKRIA
jgi:hypothetical protein